MSAVLRGRDPSTGVYLPRVKSPRRRAGWDLVFAAPKSLSLVLATASTLEPSLGIVHRFAVRGAVEHLEGESGKEIVGAAFDHIHNAGGEPHLHTHVLVANLAPTADGWAALGTWLHREELAAVYHLGLRHHLERTGLQLDWRIRPGGLPDLAVVPRAAVRAASTRSHESRSGAAWAGRNGPPRAWEASVLRAGWSSSHASRAAHETTRAHSSGTRDASASLEARVSARLLSRASTFTKRDVIVALACGSQAGFDAEAASSWAQAFCNASSPVGSDVGVPRWTTPRATDADRRLAELIEQRAERRVQAAAAGVLETSAQFDPTLSSRSRETVRSLVGDEGVVLLAADPGRSNFVADAAIGAACASVWESDGTTVAVAARSAAESARWRALSGIDAFHPSARPDVLIVDQADRRPPGELMALLSAAPRAKVVFVEGGTLPRARVDGSLGYTQTSTAVPRLDPGPTPEWHALPDGPLAPELTGVAAGKLLDHWAQSFGVACKENPTMVGLGVPETLALNDAARRHLLATGQLEGPSIEARGRSFRTGDRVVAIRGAGAGLPAGTVGAIVEVDPKRRSATISWPDRATEMKRDQLGTIGHAYAATPRLASRMEGPVFVLGRAEGLGIERSRVVAQISVERPGPALEIDRHRAGREL